MLDIKQEIEILIVRTRMRSMRNLIAKMNEGGYKIPQSGSMSAMLNKKRIRFETVQEILDYLGYELVIQEKVK